MPIQNNNRLISVIDRLMLLVAASVTLILPLGFATLAYRNLADHVDTQARVKAGAITDLVGGNPRLWTFEVQRIEHLLTRFPVPINGQAASAYDANGVLLMTAGDPPDERVLRRSHAIYDSGRIVGRVEVVQSLRGLIVGTGIAGLLGLSLGGALYGGFRTWPLREMRRLGAALEAEQAALRASEVRFRTLIEWTPEAIAVHCNGKFVYVNPGAIKTLGATSAQDLIGKPVLDFVHPDFHQIVLARMKSIADGAGATPLAELRNLRLDGTAIDVEVQSTSIVYDGQPAVLAALRDITARKVAEEKLRFSEENLAITLQSIGDAVIATDAAGLITRMNVTAERLTGWPLADAAGRPLPEVFCTVDAQTRAPAINPVQLVMERGEVAGRANHALLLARDGREYQITDSAAPILDRSGRIAGVVLVFSDGTEEYGVRQALARTTELLERTGEVAKVGGWELDVRTMKLFWSRETCRIHEVDPPLAPEFEQGMNLFAPEVRPIIQAAVQAAIDSGTPYDLELPKVTAKGRPIWVRTQGTAVMEDGKAIKLIGAFHDITERKSLELEKENDRKALELVARDGPLPDVLAHLVLGYEALFPGMRGSVLLLDPDGRHLRHAAAPSLSPAFCEALDGVEIGPGVGSCGTAVETRKTTIAANIAHDPLWRDFKDLALAHGLQACWSVPILGGADRVLGTFAFYFNAPRAALAPELAIIERGAHLAGLAIERKQAETALRASEGRYRILVEWSPEPFFIHRGGKLLYANPAASKMFGAKSAQDLVGKPILDLVHPHFHQIVLARIKDITNHGIDAPMVEQVFLKLDGTAIDVEVKGKSIVYDGTPAIHVAARDITERNQAEVARRESEERFRSVWESSVDGMRLCDATGKIVSVNSAYSSMVGKTIEELQGKSLAQVYAPEEGDRILRLFVKNAAAKTIEEYFEKECALWNGDKRWFGVSNSLLNSLRGATSVLSIFRDITERKQTGEALAAAQDRTSVLAQLGRELAEAATPKAAAIHILEASQQLLRWDSGWLHLSDERQRNKVDLVNFDLIDGGIREVFPDMSAVQTPTRMARRVKEEGPQLLLRDAESDANADFPTYGSGRRSLSLMFVPIQLGGRFIGILSIQSYQRNAYDPADLELLQSLATHCAGALVRLQSADALRASEERYRSLVEWSPEAIAVHRDGKIIYVNPVAIKMFGAISAQDLIGTPMLDRVHPDFHEIVLARAKQIIDGIHPPMIVLKYLRIDGTTFNVEAQSRSIVYDGAPAIHVAILDITERKQAEAVRVSLEAQLRESQKMEAIGTLAGGIAHDFNNILATIMGNVELAHQDMSANPLALESLEEIHKAGSRASKLVQQILSFSRRQPTERKRTALAPVVEESVRLLRATLPARLTLQVHCEAEAPLVLADAIQIQQVLINLCTNAMQAMHGRPGRVDIRLDTVMLDAALAEAHPTLRALYEARPGRTVRLAVSDDGTGMDAATLERIFEPFFTTKAVDEGTGLGLAVVHGIVQAHEGAIVVESQPGKGATFTLYLPAAAAPASVPVPDPRASAVAAAPALRLDGGQHILYLDDDESLVFLVTRMLERRGFRISGYTDQREALAAIRADPTSFDLVVTDYNMPGMSGLDVAREVRAIRADLAVAVASGFIDETLRAQADGAGVRELIFKANAVEDLCEAFARLAQMAGQASKSS